MPQAVLNTHPFDKLRVDFLLLFYEINLLHLAFAKADETGLRSASRFPLSVPRNILVITIILSRIVQPFRESTFFCKIFFQSSKLSAMALFELFTASARTRIVSAYVFKFRVVGLY